MVNAPMIQPVAPTAPRAEMPAVTLGEMQPAAGGFAAILADAAPVEGSSQALAMPAGAGSVAAQSGEAAIAGRQRTGKILPVDLPVAGAPSAVAAEPSDATATDAADERQGEQAPIPAAADAAPFTVIAAGLMPLLAPSPAVPVPPAAATAKVAAQTGAPSPLTPLPAAGMMSADTDKTARADKAKAPAMPSPAAPGRDSVAIRHDFAAAAPEAAKPPAIADSTPALPETAAAPAIAGPAAAAMPAAAPTGAPAAAPATGLAHDFTALVDRLLAAREAAAPQVVQTAIAHAEFGRVTLRFDQDDTGLTVAMSSPDPEFARIAQAAASVPPPPAAADSGSATARNGGDAGNTASGQTGARHDEREGARRHDRPEGSSTNGSSERRAGTPPSPPPDRRSGIYA